MTALSGRPPQQALLVEVIPEDRENLKTGLLSIGFRPCGPHSEPEMSEEQRALRSCGERGITETEP